VTSASRAVRVTLFEDRAEVVRRAQAQVSPGAQWIALDGVSPLVDDRSVQARVEGRGVRVLAARVWRKLHHLPTLGREEIEALEQTARAARQAAEAATCALERAEQAEVRAAELVERWGIALARVPRQSGAAAGIDPWRAAYEAADRAALDALAAAGAARADHVRAEDERRRAEERLALGHVEKPRWEAQVEVQLAADAAGAVEVEATYRVPCALWRPEHLARLAAAGPGAGSVEITTYAAAWQRTGESWIDVEMRFSTARPARWATPPLLQDDRIASRKKTEEERKQVVVETRDQDVQLAGLDRGGRTVDEMPGVDDGGVPRTFEAKTRVTLPSDGRPFRVEVARAAAKAEVARVIFPERSEVAHLRATLTHSGTSPLLAGPVRLARGMSLVGRSRLDYVGTGEPFELGFGTDDGVRARRDVAEKRETAMLTGTQKIRRTVSVYLSNLSGDTRPVLVTERVPVSEIEDVEVTLVETPGWKHDAKDGYLRAEVELAPRATRTLTFTYEIRAGAKVRLPF